MKSICSIGIIFLITIHSVLGQEENPLDIKIIPPSPEASALGKFIDMPVSPYTGIPKVEIPIYELKSYELSLPISLSYHASGIKMEELSGFVGAGWSLSAGGIVSRTIRGFNDEYPNKGYLSTLPSSNPFSVAFFFNASGGLNNNFFDYVQTTSGSGICDTLNHEQEYLNVLFAARGGLDLEPDMYFFSLPDGQSGKFVFSRDGGINMIPKQFVDMEYDMNSGNNEFEKWIIVGKDGTRYIFSQVERSEAYSECQQTLGLDVEAGQPDLHDPPNAPTSWKLEMIISASGKDTITFEYTDEILLYEHNNSYTTYSYLSGSASTPAPNSCATQLTVAAKRLSKISTSAGYEVHFISNTDREDISGGKELDQIIVKYKEEEIKTFSLTQYYEGNQSSSSPREKMLMLASIQESVGQNTIPAYEFDYNENLIVGFSRNNPNVDHWGYSNGVTTNWSKSPSVIHNNIFYLGDNREANLDYCKQWSLRKVTYPTGGTTELEYELNDYSNVPNFSEQTFRNVPGIEELASIEFNITSNINDNYSDTKQFTLPEATDVIYIYTIPEIPGGGIPASGCGGQLTCPSPLFLKNFIQDGPIDQPITSLPTGTYTLTAEFDPSEFQWGGIDLSTLEFSIKVYKVLSMEELVENNSLKGGGLRIKKITAKGDNTITKTYDYNIPGSNISSGKIMVFPSYAYLIQKNDDTYPFPGNCNISGSGTFIARTAASNLSLTLSQGAYVGYDVVTEYLGNSSVNNGYTIYKYENYPDEMTDQAWFPIVPQQSYSYKNGVLNEQFVHRSDGKLVKYTKNTYRYLYPEVVATGIRIAEGLQTSCKGCHNRKFVGNVYTNFTERVELGETLNKVYDITNDNYQEHQVIYSYNEYDQVAISEETTSIPGKQLFTKYQYHTENHTAISQKYSFYSADLTSPREYKEGLEITYNSLIKPATIALLESPKGSVTGDPTHPQFVYRIARSITDYDSEYGNVLSYTQNGVEQTRTSFIWGYDGLRPIAEVINAPINKIAFSSFETPSAEGGWIYGAALNTAFHTGSKSYSGLGITPIETDNLDLSAGKYIVSFWSTNSNFQITYQEGTTVTQSSSAPIVEGIWTLYTITLDITGINRELKISRVGGADITIDDLRLYPEGAQMTTYSHNPTIGMTSATDINNVTTYYMYDDLNRLYRMIDFEGNILKQFEYHYERDNN